MKNCVKCKKELEDNVVFCSFCGTNQPATHDIGGTEITPRKRNIKALFGGILGFVTMLIFEIAVLSVFMSSGLIDWYMDLFTDPGAIMDFEALEGLLSVLGFISLAGFIPTTGLVTGILGLVYYFTGKTGKGAFVLAIISTVLAALAFFASFTAGTTAVVLSLLGVAAGVGAIVTIAMARKEEA